MTKVLNILSAAILSLGALATLAEAQVTKDNLDQNADQSQGNYAATNLNYLGGVGSLGMMQSAWKDPLQHMGEGQTRPGYTKYYWTPELVLPVRVREGMYTLINFPNWEVIENVYIGDGQSFNAEIQGPSSLMVYPDSSQFVGVDTNMIVFGRSGNKYVFYVQSETVNTDRITNAIIDIEVVKNRQNANGSAVIGAGTGGGHINANSYSQDGTSADATFTRNLQKEDWIEKIPVDPTKFRFDIEVYVPNPDDIVIAPERVWRDNIFTYIDLGDKALTAVQRPIVTLIVERSETPVGFRTAGPNNRLIIVEGMGDMVLRSGRYGSFYACSNYPGWKIPFMPKRTSGIFSRRMLPNLKTALKPGSMRMCTVMAEPLGRPWEIIVRREITVRLEIVVHREPALRFLKIIHFLGRKMRHKIMVA